MRNSVIPGESSRAWAGPLAASLLASALVAGCSTDVQRFGYTGSVAPTAAVSPAPVDSVESAPLAGPAGAYNSRSSYQNTAYTPPSSGGSVVVQSGDTAYSIARRNGVTVEQLVAANGLSYPYNVRIGQRLTLPGGATPTPVAAGTSAPAPARVASRPGTGSHTVAPGDTLYSISQRYGVGVAALADANDLDNYGTIQIGQMLRIPSATAATAVGGPLTVTDRPDTTDTGARVLASRTIEEDPAGEETRVASADPTAGAAVTPAREESRFRWPVRGRIIARYGIGPDGQRNDGVNISVPEGASVKAAEDGIVAYAGNELQGYGNLILIRHANDWVTAYAHNSTLLVSRGDTVQRGQIIAKAGQTGSVDKPQVHFEIRQGSKAVDPLPYLEGA